MNISRNTKLANAGRSADQVWARRRSALSAAVGALLCFCAAPGAQSAITITFVDNTNPLNPYPAISPFQDFPFERSGPPPHTTGAFTEFRVVTRPNPPDDSAVSGGGHKSLVGTTPSDVVWNFNDLNQLSSVSGTDFTPGALTATNYDNPACPDGAPGAVTVAPNGDVGLFKNAPFLQVPFGFLAPTVGSLAANAYGVGTISPPAGDSFVVTIPVAEAQWNGGMFRLGISAAAVGVDPGDPDKGIRFFGALAADNHTFKMNAEQNIQPCEDSLGFAGQATQWDLSGTLNTIPVGATANRGTQPNTPIVINASEFGTDADGDTLTIASIATLPGGTATATIVGGGTGVSFDSTGNGNFSFTVNLADGFGGTAVGTANVNVSPNPPPIANNDTPSMDQGQASTTITVLANDSADAIPTTVAIGANGTKGTAVANASGTITYTPGSQFTGTDTFTYTVQDDIAQTSTAATVTVTVNVTTPSTTTGPVTAAPGPTVLLTTAQLPIGTPADPGVSSQCDPTCWGFTAPASGGIASVVLPLPAPGLPATAIVRKLRANVWGAFNTSAPNSATSAAATGTGSCPPPGSPVYSPLQAGHRCLQLRIADGGLNDADGLVNSSVTDPGGLATPPAGAGAPAEEHLDSGSGCSLRAADDTIPARGDWWLIAGFIAALGLLRRRFARAVETLTANSSH